MSHMTRSDLGQNIDTEQRSIDSLWSKHRDLGQANCVLLTASVGAY